MGKNFNGNNKGNQRKNYFKENIQRNGENFLSQKNPRIIEKDAIRIFRDIARNNVDVYTECKYFYDPQFFEACYSRAVEEYNYYRVNYSSNCAMFNAGYQDPYLQDVTNSNKRSMEAFYLIIDALNNFRTTMNLEYFNILKNNLYSYRFNIGRETLFDKK